jgi:hypothetical protein
MNSPVQQNQSFIKPLTVSYPVHSINTGSRVALELQITLAQQSYINMVHKGSELQILASLRRTAHSQQPGRRNYPALSPDCGG